MNFFRNPWAIVLLIVLVILLFGANKLPGLARNMGKSMRIFKTEVEELRGDEKSEDEGEGEEDDRRDRSSRAREDRRSDRSDDRTDGREADREADHRSRADREYDPRDDAERDRDPVRAREDEDPYRRD